MPKFKTMWDKDKLPLGEKPSAKSMVDASGAMSLTQLRKMFKRGEINPPVFTSSDMIPIHQSDQDFNTSYCLWRDSLDRMIQSAQKAKEQRDAVPPQSAPAPVEKVQLDATTAQQTQVVDPNNPLPM